MAFGQASGPPASARQVQELLALVRAAGHDGFRDARGPLGLTQRQAAGRFTGPEATALIDHLLAAEHAADQGHDTDGPRHRPSAPGSRPPTARQPGERVSAAERRRAQQAQAARDIPSEILAGELQRRGWAVLEP